MLGKRRYISFFIFLFFAYGLVFFLYCKKLNIQNIFGYKPFFSVVVASYNYERFLPQTLDSILAQKYKKYEVIIVDDGSKDNSVQLIKKYTEKYKNFHLYQHENGVNKGLPATIKLAVQKAKGDYIAFLESDDYWRDDKLEDIASLIKRNREAIIISNAVIPFGETDKTQEVKRTKNYLEQLENTLKNEKNFINEDSNSFFNLIPTFSAVVIKKDVLKKLNYNTPIPAFLDLWLYKQILHKYPLYHSKKTTTFWRKHSQSFNSEQKQKENYEKSDIFVKKIKEILSDKN